MKKFVTIAVSLVLVAALSIGVLAVNQIISTPKMDEVLAHIDGNGKEFLVSANKPESAAANYDAVLDGNDATSWKGNVGDSIQVNFDELTTLNNISIKEVGANVRYFSVDAWNGSEWVQVYSNDLIQNYHLCIFSETVLTYAIKVNFEKTIDNAGVEIATLNADYQAPVALDKEFINMAYMTDNSYYHKWDPIEDWKMNALTDLILHGNWAFNSKGEFVIRLNKKGVGVGNDERAISPDSQEAKDFIADALKEVDGYCGEYDTPDLWISITCQKNTNDGFDIPDGHSDVFKDDAIRAKFVADVVNYVAEYGFVGVDFDWEYPSTAEEWQAYDLLINDLSAALHDAGKYLSTAQAHTVCGLSDDTLQKFDRINIMAYDNMTIDGQHSTFQVSANEAIKYFLNRGVPADKLVLGLPWYADALNNSSAQTGWADSIYSTLLMMSEDGETIDRGLNTVKGYSFNGPNLLRDKVVYALQNKIGGVFCWQIKNDLDEGVEIAGTTPPKEDHLAYIVSSTIEEFSFVKESK